MIYYNNFFSESTWSMIAWTLAILTNICIFKLLKDGYFIITWIIAALAAPFVYYAFLIFIVSPLYMYDFYVLPIILIASGLLSGVIGLLMRFLIKRKSKNNHS